MKTINFELSKRLNDLGLLDNMKTQYAYNKSGGVGDAFYHRRYIYKTLTLEEGIKFLPTQINNYYFVLGKNDGGYWCNYLAKDEDKLYILNEALFKETSLETIEKMIEYLLNNNLLTK